MRHAPNRAHRQKQGSHGGGAGPRVWIAWPWPPETTRSREHFSYHLNCGIAGAAMCGCGSGAILEALPTPLGSTTTLFIPPAFPGPRGIPLIGTCPIAAEPAGRANPAIAAEPACPPPCPPRANEATGEANTMNNAIATFAVVLDMGKLHDDSLERRSREAHVGSQSADTTKLNFINWILESISVQPSEREVSALTFQK